MSGGEKRNMYHKNCFRHLNMTSDITFNLEKYSVSLVKICYTDSSTSSDF